MSFQQITANVSSSGFTFTFRVTIIVSVFVPGRWRVVQKLREWVCTTRDRPGTKTEIIIVTINVKVNPEEDTFTEIFCKRCLIMSFLITHWFLWYFLGLGGSRFWFRVPFHLLFIYFSFKIHLILVVTIQIKWILNVKYCKPYVYWQCQLIIPGVHCHGN